MAGDELSSSLRRGLRRNVRRLLRQLHAPAVEFVYSERYSHGHSAVPYDPLRGERILTFLSSEGLIGRRSLHRPRAASIQALRRIHTDAYLDSLHEPETLTRVVGVQVTDPEMETFLETQRFMAGGTIQAAHLVRRGGHLAINLAGGTHHASADRGQGFCVFNDVAVAIASLREHQYHGRILVIDLDLHDGDGTRSIFALDDSVYTFSIHNQPWGDEQAVASTSIALGSGVGDATYLDTLRRELPPVFKSFRPQLVFYLAGCDPAADDQIGDWQITAQGMLERDLLVLSLLRRAAGFRLPAVIVLAGGYGSEAWRYSARFFAHLLTRRRPPEPPSTEEITLLRYRHLSSVLDPGELTGQHRAGDDWGLTEEDLYGTLAPAGRETRFLGYYSKQGLELVLERSGLFDRLRALGFRGISLEWDLNDASGGQTLRVYGDAAHRELLSELRARRDRRTVPGMELLGIEWLLLQNPRQTFPDDRPPLPGQHHPGLGMLRDVIALLVRVCERLGLDGLSFVPSHYHLVGPSSKMLRFLNPEDEIRFQALKQALRSRPLAEASRAVDEGRVRNAQTGQPFSWQPMPMVLPVSPRLEAHFNSPEMEQRRRQAREAGLRFELVGVAGASGRG